MFVKTGYYLTKDHIFLVKGEKAGQFLHGQFTNSITDLQDGCGNYNLFLSLKGKVRADLFVLSINHQYYLIIPQHFSKLVVEYLKKIAPLSGCEVIDLSQDYKTLHIVGQDLDQADHFELVGEQVILFRTDRLGEIGFDLVVPSDFELKNFQEIDEKERELIRIKNGVPKVGEDVTENHLPQEGGLKHALHFNKGCYLGQEVVARLEHRGNIKKILTRFSSNNSGISVGDPIVYQGKPCGQITSVVEDDKDQIIYMLGYISVDLNKSGTEFDVDGRKIKIL